MGSANSKLKVPLASCDTYPVTNSGESTLSAGAFNTVGSLLGVIYDDIAAGEDGVMIIRAPAMGMAVPKAGSLAISEGDVLYYDSGEAEVNKTNTNPFFGYATADAGEAATEVYATFGPTNPAVGEAGE